MREIKFRVWDKEKKEFILDLSNFWIRPDNFNIFMECRNDIGIAVFEPNQSAFIFQQFTNLLDKNGKEIYEGDIVKSSVIINSISPSMGIFLVRYNQFLCDYELDWFGKNFYEIQTTKQKRNFNKKYQDFDTDFAKLTGAKSEKLEIIGNIFQNPELVK